MSDPVRVVGVVASLRQGSYNRLLMRAAQEALPPGMQLELAEIADIPFYDGDVEAAGLPAPVQRFKAQIRAADALLIATPEYNYAIPGLLKNALDWASRPAGQSALAGKAMAVIGASTGVLGTARAQMQLRQLALGLDVQVANRPEVLLGHAASKFDAQGRLTDETARTLLGNLLLTLQSLALRLRG
ncbi:NADPH-dependent FMN reductase [Dokdonella koreensis]|uniref:NADPH:quinone oxidoreductase n=1 Tax=Dokdonella koreensis DS-123 TaxID=1300342 RepID=A0A160DS01_9GAMM|nr:NAD(P)H-dependent oxidoreductase [Dokdonella koreensis]ANB17017.1 NADPH:quinone oxidoreductase [Dokdonella koreensis DS-123]